LSSYEPITAYVCELGDDGLVRIAYERGGELHSTRVSMEALDEHAV
jgi:hypothetical protein